MQTTQEVKTCGCSGCSCSAADDVTTAYLTNMSDDGSQQDDSTTYNPSDVNTDDEVDFEEEDDFDFEDDDEDDDDDDYEDDDDDDDEDY